MIEITEHEKLIVGIADSEFDILDTLEEVHQTQVIVFNVGEHRYALSIDQVKEIISTPHVANVPHTAAYIRGLANVKGEVITLIDLHGMIDAKSRRREVEGGFTLVVEEEFFRCGLVVNDMPESIKIDTSSIKKDQDLAIGTPFSEKAIKGVITMDDQFITLLDIVEVMKNERIETSK